MQNDKGSCGTNTGSCGTGGTNKGACDTTPMAGTGGASGTATGGKCCGKMILAAVLGGIVMYAWISVSWMALPWHKDHMRPFKDEKAVSNTIGKNINGSGIYIMPNTNMGKDKQKTDKPYAFVVVKEDGIDVAKSMGPAMGKEFVLCLFLAGLLGCVLRKTAGCGCPVAMSAKIGLLAGLAAYVPQRIWFHFPLDFTVVGVVETVVAFTLAGFVIAKFVLKQKIGCSKSACTVNPTMPK